MSTAARSAPPLMDLRPVREVEGRLRTASLRLNEITDKAISAVRQTEQFLNEECSIGLPVSVPASVNSEIRLAYSRIGGKYRICIVGKDENARPWADCPRDEKLKTFNALPNLLEAIAIETEKMVAAVRESVEKTTEILS